MESLWNNRVLITAFAAWMTAQMIKTLIYRILYKRFDKERIFGSGGMPSSHTATVIALTLSVGIREGFVSSMFSICAVFSMVVIYDALGVRRETGRQGEVINRILREFLLDGKPLSEENMKTLVGHTPLEVLGGVIIGLGISLLFMLF